MEVIEATEVVEAVEVIEAVEVPRSEKSLFRTQNHSVRPADVTFLRTG